MKNLIYLFLVMTLFASCKTVKILPGTETVTKITSRDTTVEFEKTIPIDKQIEVPVPNFKDSVQIRDSIRFVDPETKINPPEIKPVKIEKRNGMIAGTFIMDKTGKYEMNFHLTDSSFLYHFKDTITVRDTVTIKDASKTETTVTTKTVVLPPERYIPKIHKISLWIVIIELILIIAWVIIRLKFGAFLDRAIRRFKQ